MGREEGVPVAMAAAGLVMLINLGLSLAVGVRLRSAGTRGRAPERALALHFLCTAFLGTLCLVPVYAQLADAAVKLPDLLARVLLGGGTLAMLVGQAGVYLFTWRTFRPESARAKAAVVLGCAVGAVGFLIEAGDGGFALRIVPGLGHWLSWLGRTAPMVWVAVECLRYRSLLLRRVRIGLADPVVANRVGLWGVWAAAGFLNVAADLVSRLVYRALAGTTEAVPELLRPVFFVTTNTTMVLGAVSAVTLFLTFFPPRAYLRWVRSRAAAQA